MKCGKHFPKKYCAQTSFDQSGFPVYKRLLQLSYHLLGKRNCTFREDDNLEKVLEREKFRRSQLEAFFQLNREDINARKYTYDEILQHYVWNVNDNVWTLCKRGTQIGRLLYTHHSAGEIWYLRLLLTKVRGPTSFDCLKSIDGVVYSTFKEACTRYGFLDDDNEWNELLEECAKCGFPPQIRELFVHIMVNCKVTDLGSLWLKHWKTMTDDIIMHHRNVDGSAVTGITDKQLQFYALAEVDKLLRCIGKSLKQFSQMPQPPSSYIQSGSDNMIVDELSYSIDEMEQEFTV
ncbi:hypothetical protein POM88_039673 [Heracleum sosnowskyi]|uniref:Uncharacterized protein n=1 Tax=Heracleum sosnowskyi TaxID=360622 RepID=A0AAD8M921_9APIA|nr:hypothetical protein POM88_039673 [Heracleum sosnowskyi]